MTEPIELILRDVRCFKGEQRGRLRPITLLLGENSTGKSTFLACFSVIHRMFSGTHFLIDAPPDFNREPFSMGSFRDIVRSRHGRTGGIKDFKIGLTFTPNSGSPTNALVTFQEQGSQPVRHSCRYQFSAADFIELLWSEERKTTLRTQNGTYELPLPVGDLRALRSLLDYGYLEGESVVGDDAKNALFDARRLLDLDGDADNSTGRKRHLALVLSSLVPVAPLRAKPKRTYDPTGEAESPEGTQVPMLMMRLDHEDKGDWSSLHDHLVQFGKNSGLFSDIKVRRHGRQISDPFQIQVKVRSSSHANIMDVGYGVSQSLPILVNLLTEKGNQHSRRSKRRMGRTFLLQQPEVHLHPRGQAELAQLFAQVASQGRDRFLIETHSDYIVDRVRILVRKKLLSPEDVSVIFFEPQHNAVEMHNISLDEAGNLENVPPSYRSFFLKETDQLLGFDD